MSNVLVKTTWGSDDPTRAALAFLHGNALVRGGHDVQIFLIGEAVSVMREAVRNALVPVGWPPLAEIMAETHELGTQIHVCTACSLARGVVESDLTPMRAIFGTPESFVGLIEWSDKILAE
jgi:predicted peroxiredoxin